MQIAGIELEDLEYDNIGSWPLSLRIIIFILMALITFYIGYIFYLSDTIDQYYLKKNERITLQQNYEIASDQASNLEEYKKQIVEVRRSLDSLRQQLPRDSRQADLLDSLSELAISNDVSIVTVDPKDEVYKGFYYAQPMELHLLGNYHNFGLFVASVSNMPRLVTLHDFIIKLDPKNLSKLNITLNAESYWTGEEVSNVEGSQTQVPGILVPATQPPTIQTPAIQVPNIQVPNQQVPSTIQIPSNTQIPMNTQPTGSQIIPPSRNNQ